MDDLLKEAIADAKAVRETALENAKMALEEAFTPKLQSMLSKKIQMEMDDEMEDEIGEEEESAEEEPIVAQDEDPSDEFSEEEEMPAEPEMEEEGIIEIDGVKYAPVVSEEDEEDMETEAEGDDMEDQEEDLDLEAVIKELEDELEEGDEEEVEEAKEEDEVEEAVKEEKDEDEMDEDIDLDEVLKALSEEEDEEKEVDEVSELKSDLAEHRSVIETLRGKLNEVNLLNAKLLFTNKLFRKYGLNNEQKMKVVEQFDRAASLREVKLVYSTLGESFVVARNNINEHKGSASKPVASTKSEKKVISESTELRDRFKKLANLI